MEQVAVKFIGHACFKLSCAGAEIVLDPYADGMIPGLGPVDEEAHFVYCSHQHDDHNYVQAVRRKEWTGELPFSVEELETHHDDCGGAKRGMNTVRVFTFGALRVAHLGDLGRTLTGEEAALLSGADCLLIPVGGYYTIDAETAKAVLAQVGPRVTIPMHYRGEGFGFDVIGTAEQFTAGLDNVNHGGSELILTGDTPAQVLVLRPAAAK